MKNCEIYFFIFFLIVFDVNVVTGSEKWSVEGLSILDNIALLNQKMKTIGDENAMIKKENDNLKRENNLFKIAVQGMKVLFKHLSIKSCEVKFTLSLNDEIFLLILWLKNLIVSSEVQ